MADANDKEDRKPADLAIVRAFEDFLGSSKTDDAFNSILRDYSPKKQIITDPSGQVKIEEKPATGLTLGTFFKTVGLFFRKPRSTYNLLRFVSNQEKYNNLEFQKAIISSDALWGFVQNTAAQNLDKVGEMMQNFGVNIFAEGRMLDKEALSSLQSSMTSSDVIQNMKQIALQSMESQPNYIKITTNALKLIDQSPGFKNYFETKGDTIKNDISNYIKTAAETEKSDLEKWKTFNAKDKKKFLDDKGYSKQDINKILNSNELPKGVGSMVADAGITLDDLDKMLDILPILMKQTGNIGDITEKIDQENLIAKGQDIASIAKGIRRNPRAIAQILEKLSEGDFIGVVEDSLTLMDTNPEMQQYLTDNKETFGKIIVTSLNENKEFQASGLSGDIVNIVPYLMNHPKELLEIIDAQKKGDFVEVGDKTLKLINENQEIKHYFAKNTNGIKNFAMAIIKAEIVDQLKELSEGGLPEHNILAVSLNQYGLNINDVHDLVEIVPVLLNKTDNFGKIMQQVKKGQYQELAIDALDMVGPGQEINNYISKNKHIFGKILENSVKENPIFSDVKGNVVEILPILLNDPESLKILIKQGIDQQFLKLPETVLNMLETNKDLQIYLNNNREVMHSVAIKLLGLESYKIPKDISDAMLDLTNPQNISQMKKLLPLASAGKWDDLIIGTTSMIEKDPNFAQTMKDNKDGFAKLINTVIDKIPQAKTYLGEAKLGKIGANILADPGSIRSIVEGWQKGYVAVAQAGVVAVAKSLMNPEIRNGLTKQAQRWWNGASSGNQEVVNSIAIALNARGRSSGEDKIKLSDFISEAFEAVAQNINDESIKNKLSKKVTRKVLFENTSISGTADNMVNFTNLDITGNSFVNTKLSNVSFRDTDLRNVTFNGASFNNIDLKGASIDSTSFDSMRNGIIAGKISLDGVKFVGDFKNLDLSNIDFSKSDLTQVTSFQGSTITNSSFYDVKYPKEQAIITDTFGFNYANIDNENILTDDRFKLRNEKFIATQITDGISYKSANLNDDVISKEAKADLLAHIEELSSDLSPLGNKLRYLAAHAPADLNEGKFPLDVKSFKHVEEYRDKFSHMLTDIYEHRHNPTKIEEVLVADIIAQDVTKGLFGDGSNRAQDGLKIKTSIIQAVEQYSKTNGISPRNILCNSNYERIVGQIVADIYPRTVSTTAGTIARTGGIQLGPETINTDLIQKFTDHMNLGAGIHEFNHKEINVIDDLAEKIVDNVFGSNSKKNKNVDFEAVKITLQKSIHDIKSTIPGVDLSTILTEHNSTLVGSYNKSGLAKEYYDNTKYFGRGLSDDIHLTSFRNKISTYIEKVISNDLQLELINQKQLQENITHAKSSKIQKGSFQAIAQHVNKSPNGRG